MPTTTNLRESSRIGGRFGHKVYHGAHTQAQRSSKSPALTHSPRRWALNAQLTKRWTHRGSWVPACTSLDWAEIKMPYATHHFCKPNCDSVSLPVVTEGHRLTLSFCGLSSSTQVFLNVNRALAWWRTMEKVGIVWLQPAHSHHPLLPPLSLPSPRHVTAFVSPVISAHTTLL